MTYTLRYLPEVKKDLEGMDSKTKQRIRKALRDRVGKDPRSYGKPLRKSLKSFYRLRVGDYRVVYCILEDRKEVLIIGIMHRKEIYKRILSRIFEIKQK